MSRFTDHTWHGLNSVDWAVKPLIRQTKWPKTSMSQHMRLWYLPDRRRAKAQASLHICAVSPEPSLFAHMMYGSRWRVRRNMRPLAPLDGCACAFDEWVYGGCTIISWDGANLFYFQVVSHCELGISSPNFSSISRLYHIVSWGFVLLISLLIPGCITLWAGDFLS